MDVGDKKRYYRMNIDGIFRPADSGVLIGCRRVYSPIGPDGRKKRIIAEWALLDTFARID